jgi:hypothetical protein
VQKTAVKQPIRLLPAENTLWSLQKGAAKQEANAPIFIHAHIPLAGYDLTNNHTF